MSKTPDAFIVTKNDGGWDLVGKSVLDNYAIKTSDEGSKQIKSDGWNYEQLHEPLYDPEQLTDLLELNTYHAQCCDVVAKDAGGLGWFIKPVSEEPDLDETNKKVLTNFFNRFKCNEVLYRRQYDRRALGYGAIEIIRTGGSRSPLHSLTHIPGHTLRRHTDGKRVLQRVGSKTVWFILYGSNKDLEGNVKYDVHCETGETHPPNTLTSDERANELLWGMDYTPKSQFYGLPKIVPGIRAIYGDISRADFNTSFFKNYGMPAFAVMVTGDFETYDKQPGDEGYDETKTLKYKISQQIKEVMRNPHSAVTLLIPSEGEEGNVKVEIKPLSVETKEASFRLYRKDNRDEIIAAHRVPPYRIGINETGSLSGNTSVESTKIYKTSVIEPLQSDDEYDINLLIREEFGFQDCQFALQEIDVRDFAIDVGVAEKLFNMASMTPRQLIQQFGERFGLKDDPDNYFLDEYYLNGQPLELAWLGERAAPGSSTVLDELENDIRGDINESGLGDENITVKTAFKNLRRRLQRPVEGRGKLK